MSNLLSKEKEIIEKIQHIDTTNNIDQCPSLFAIRYQSFFNGIDNPLLLSNDQLSWLMVHARRALLQTKDYSSRIKFPYASKSFIILMNLVTNYSKDRLEEEIQESRVLKGAAISNKN